MSDWPSCNCYCPSLFVIVELFIAIVVANTITDSFPFDIAAIKLEGHDEINHTTSSSRSESCTSRKNNNNNTIIKPMN